MKLREKKLRPFHIINGRIIRVKPKLRVEPLKRAISVTIQFWEKPKINVQMENIKGGFFVGDV